MEEISEHSEYVFFYPTNTIGGAQLLFARLATRMADEGLKVIVIEKESKYISSYLSKEKVQFSCINLARKEKYQTCSNQTLILSASFASIVNKSMNVNQETKLFFWELHPFAIVEQLLMSGWYKNNKNGIHARISIKTIDRNNRKILGQFINTATLNYGFAFMSNKNEDYNRQFFDFCNNVSYLPIPVQLKEKWETSSKTMDNNICRISWLGRLDFGKVHLLKQLLNDLDAILESKNSRIVVTIIGDGNGISEMKDHVKHLKVKVKWLGTLHGADLEEVILNQTDFGIAIGTSTLEFSRRGVASVLMPGVNEVTNFGPSKYDWLYNSISGDLCTVSTRKASCKDLESIVNEYFKNPKMHSLKSYEYTLKNHSIDNIYKSITTLLSKNTFTFNKFESIGMSQLSDSNISKLKALYKTVRKL